MVVATRTMIIVIIVLLVRLVGVVLLLVPRRGRRRRGDGVEAIFVLKVSASGVREQVGEVIVRVVIVRLVVAVLGVGARHHPVRVRTMRGQCIGDLLGEEEVGELVRILAPSRTRLVAIRVVGDQEGIGVIGGGVGEGNVLVDGLWRGRRQSWVRVRIEFV